MGNEALQVTLPAGLPVGRRTPRGRLRWYLASVPDGREQALCDKVRRLVEPELLDDAFVIQKEWWFKRQGTWTLSRKLMYPGYFFVATKDVIALDRRLAKLSLPVRVVGSGMHAYAPLDAGAQAWFSGALDENYTIRSSTAVIEDGTLHVQNGPLMGQEEIVSGIDRHRRTCKVTVGEGSGSFSEILAIDVPFKS